MHAKPNNPDFLLLWYLCRRQEAALGAFGSPPTSTGLCPLSSYLCALTVVLCGKIIWLVKIWNKGSTDVTSECVW